MTRMKKTTAVRATRREAAEKRQAQYDALSIEQRLSRLESRPGIAGVETARLMNQQASR